ncbi:translation initiation factor aIF-2 [Cryptococcus gattii Ru294]|nr:translation initiation factor aIF-2 [Cryptococcus gattii Ru294]
MPPKNKGKKGGKKDFDDDEFWEKKEAALEQSQTTLQTDEAPKKGKKADNSLFDLLDDGDAVSDEEGGGLMATIAANAAKKDKKKKKKASKFADLDDEADEVEPPSAVDTKPNLDDEWPEEDVKPKKGKKGKKEKKRDVEEDEELDEVPAPADEQPEPSTAVNLDDEWPEEDVKPKKGKKGKKGKKVEEEEEDIDAILEKAAAERKAQEASNAPAKVEPEPEAEEAMDEGPKILSKAQKEKLKKEKEKAKKKAQAAAKKVQAPPTESPAEPAEIAEAEDDEGDEEGAAGGDKKKKKKKKAAAKPAEPAPSAKGKKIPAHIAAMQAAMEEKRRLEEEAKKAEEERLRRIEEEEARIAAEEAAEAEAKAAKKAKEREKLAKAKAEGKLLTPAQKRERAAAEARKQAMLAAGMVVAGLQEGGAAEKKKKPVYGNKKKQQQQQQQKPKETPAPAAPAPEPEAPKAEEEKEESEDDWDKSDNEVEKATAAVEKLKVEESEDDWDKSDEEPAPEPVKASAPAAKEAPPRAKVAEKPAEKAAAPAASTQTQPASKAAPVPAKANGKPTPAAAEESSSEEEESSSEEESSDEESDEDSDEDSDDELAARKARALQKIQERREAAQAAKSSDDLRSPICCILGHVDTGKTKLLDKIRQTSVQEGEAGGITQQIGATFFPRSAIEEKTEVVNKDHAYKVQIPGLLIIDTPGHESFTNLRSRGSSLCNIAILVVDITHGLEPQTIESLNLLRQGRTPFIVALNKIDRMYGWEAKPNAGFRETLNAQSKSVKSEFDDRVAKTKLAFAEQGLNAEIFDENKNLGRNISLVPTSAISGEGIPDMLMLLVKLTQERMNANLMYISELECTILEVKVIEGLGTTIDVVLSNGVMREGDKIVLCGTDGPIVTQVRALLTPQPMREMRIKGQYIHHKEVKAALGVKISAPGLEKAIAGARLYVAQDDDEVEAFKDMAMDDLTSLARFVTKSGKGVWVQASTLGSLEALLTFLDQMKIPVFNFGIGPVHKSTIVKAGTMLDKAPEYAVILAFDVQIEKEAQELAQKAGIKIFSAMIIYHLFDAFTKYMSEVQEAKRKEAAPNAVWPVRLKILKAFAHRDPIILGCDIIEGTMRIGTPMGVVKVDKETGKREIVSLGKITSIEINHKPFEIVKRSQIGAGAAVKIERAPHQPAKLYGRHFDEKDEVVSLISRQSIDTLKANFRDQVELSDWAMIKKMKVEQGVP